MHSGSPPHWLKPFAIAQLSTWSTKNCTSAQPSATQLETHVMLNSGGMDPRSMQPKAHVTISMQPIASHLPQSSGHMAQVSKSSHLPFGQNEQTPQSCWHDAQFSLPVHTPSPHPSQTPQSVGQLK